MDKDALIEQSLQVVNMLLRRQADRDLSQPTKEEQAMVEDLLKSMVKYKFGSVH